MTDGLIGVDQKILDWLTETMFLGEFERAIRSGVKSVMGWLSWALSQMVPLRAHDFLFNG